MSSSVTLIAQYLARFHAMSYAVVPESRGKRDLRIDLLRGFCVFVMIVDHVGGETSWLYALTGGNHFFVSAAEGFVLLSGVSMGMVHASVIGRDGVRAMLTKVAGRARFLYVLTVGLTIAFAGASAMLGTPWAAAATPSENRIEFALEVITFHRSYSLTDVLVLYTLLVLSAGPLLWLMARGRTAMVLALSFGAWTLAQVSLDLVPRAWPIVDGGFPFSAWQLLFVIGLAIGFHRRRLAPYLEPSRLIAVGIAASLALLFIDGFATRYVAGWIGVDVQTLLFDKNDARIGRVIALLGAASFLYAAVSLLWVPVRARLAWLLMPMGTRSLYAYGVQLFVVAFWSSGLMAPVRLDRENALFQGAAVLMVWAACVAQPRAAVLIARARAALARLSLAAARPMFRPVAACLAAVLLATSCGGAGATTTHGTLATATVAADSWEAASDESIVEGDPGPGRVEQGTFFSAALQRTMTYLTYLPPGYDETASDRYPTLYMLHGGGGDITEWIGIGLFSTADSLIRAGTIAPMIIVLPQGDQEYWVDHVVSDVTGANGEKWGTYTARDVVPTIDARYRTIADASARAVGGLSMGAHGAMQLALNFPGVWSIVGAHSPSLRIEGDAPTYLGYGAEFAARDPYALIAAKPDLARTITWWIDSGDVDPWRASDQAIADELTALGIPVQWHPYAGDHSATYWSTHVADYLAFYTSAFAAMGS